MDIITDTVGAAELLTKDRLIESDEDDIEFQDHETERKKSSKFFDIEENLLQNEATSKKVVKNVTKDIDLDEFENDMGWSSVRRKGEEATSTKLLPDVAPLTEEVTVIDQILNKSVIKSGFEKLQAVPPYDLSEKRLQSMRRKERSKTKGKDWFNMRAPELTPEVRRDLQVLQMRSVLDPKRFYKKNDTKALPKYFQIGKVVDTPLDYYSGRLTNKERKKTIVDELMADVQFSKYNKRKYKEIIDEKKKTHYKAYRHARKLKRRKK